MTTPHENELLAGFNDGPPEAVLRRYEELSKTRDAEALTPAEHAELIGLSETIEADDVRRLECIAALAKLRGASMRTLCSEALGRFRGASAGKDLTAKLLLERGRERDR